MASTETVLQNNSLHLFPPSYHYSINDLLFENKSFPQKISIILPCYNEAKTILQVVNKIQQLNLPLYEIIVVDDASTDGSFKLLEGKEHVKTFRHRINQGYGKTLLDGIFQSTGDVIITMDSDGQHDPRDIPTLCKAILENEADFVIGSRYHGKYCYSLPLTNRIGEAFIEIMIKVLFNETIQNNQGGFRVFNRKALSIFQDIKFDGMAFTTELIMKAKIQNLRINSSPIHLYGRIEGKSRVKKLPLLINILRSFFIYGLRYYDINIQKIPFFRSKE
ncbi:glycosyltransferase family 2 protein [Candidatus Lokiarchaeum ossiferum]|uniref:glycosyltransferase family 2 protein n=1 Tax=Candidatus Lokiarchaeum ossiferum TaxID=2951803 RepID=UPI00352C980E